MDSSLLTFPQISFACMLMQTVVGDEVTPAQNNSDNVVWQMKTENLVSALVMFGMRWPDYGRYQSERVNWWL